MKFCIIFIRVIEERVNRAIQNELDKKLVEEVIKYQRLYRAEITSNIQLQVKMNDRPEIKNNVI